MKWLITLVALATVLIVAGTSAAGSAGKDPRVPALQKQVTALATQVTTLQQQVQHDELVTTSKPAVAQPSALSSDRYPWRLAGGAATDPTRGNPELCPGPGRVSACSCGRRFRA